MASQKVTNNRNRNRGKQFEARVAKFLGYFRIPYSGSSELWGLGDVRDFEDKDRSRVMIECKTMTPKSVKEINYIIKRDWIVGPDSVVAKAKKENNKMPALAFTRKGSKEIFAILRLVDFKLFLDCLELLRQAGILDKKLKDIDEIREQIGQKLEEFNDGEENNK